MAHTRRLLFASWYSDLGGGETDLLTLAQSLDPAQFVPHLLLPREGQLAAAWRSQGWPVHQTHWRGATTLFVPALWRRFPAVQRMAHLLRTGGFALVHADYHTLPLLYPAALQTRTPLVWTVHGWWFRPRPWQRAFFRPIPAVARSYSIRDGFLGVPPFMPPDALPVIYSGVDTARFCPVTQDERAGLRAALDVAPGAPLVAMVARFQPVKGHHHFQAMAAQVLAQRPDVHFIVAGEAAFGGSRDAAYRARILAQAQSVPALRYLGFRPDVERLLAAADVVVCPSDFESYGKVNIEAMACGVPVVSTNRGGPAETVVDGVTGYLVAPGDVAGMAQRVLQLLADPALRAQMGAAGRERVVTTFSLAASTRQYAAFFERWAAAPT